MTGKAVILALLIAGAAHGQSSMRNVPYRPQPRILIPHVEAPQIVVSTNGTITANPLRNLRYSDFVLCAVDQTGTKTNPVLFQFSTVDTNQQDSAVVFYQRSGTNWPSSMERRAGSSYTVTNWTYEVLTNNFGVYTNWNLVLSATNCPSWVQIGSYSCVVDNTQVTNVFYYDTPTTFIRPIYRTVISSQTNFYGRMSFLPTTWKLYTATSSTNFQPKGWGPSGTNFIQTGVDSAEQKTNFWWSTITTNSSYDIVTVNILSISAASSNEAGAIEVFPVRQASNLSWMRQQNPDVKWMALLSNGSNFYSTASGDPVWFNCWVEWVDRIPTNGVWQ